MPTPLLGTTMALPLGSPGVIRFDIILLHPDGTKAVETVTIDTTVYPTERERYAEAETATAAAIRALYAWKIAGGA